MRSDGAQNASERWPTPRKSLEKDLLDLKALQPIEIPQNRQSFLWKGLEQNKRDLERLHKSLEDRLNSAGFAPGSRLAFARPDEVLAHPEFGPEVRPVVGREQAVVGAGG